MASRRSTFTAMAASSATPTDLAPVTIGTAFATATAAFATAATTTLAVATATHVAATDSANAGVSCHHA